MSDPVSNSEIEDVLASIRRLVSENAKALKGDRDRDPAAEKLVLTPALRIDESGAASAPADVFAVDTDTWKEVSETPEDAENKGVFSHRDIRPPEALAGDVTSDETAVEPATEAQEAALAEPAEGPQTAPGGENENALRATTAESAPSDAVTRLDAEAQAGAESAPTTPSAADALEQRISELETVMHLRPAGDETVSAEAVAHEAGQGETPAAAETPEAAEEPEAAQESDTAASGGADAAAGKVAAEASDAPPKSWIEGLVAAAATAEATRLAARVKADEGAEGTDEAEGAAVIEEDTTGAAQAEAAETVSEDEIAAARDATGSETADNTVGEEVFELTEAHAAPPEPEPMAPEADTTAPGEHGHEQPAASEHETSGMQLSEDMPQVHEPAGDDRRAEAFEEVAAENTEGDAAEAREAGPASGGDDLAADDTQAAETGDAKAGPERSWVDRLIAAAATLRDTPETTEAEQGAGEDTAEAADEMAAGKGAREGTAEASDETAADEGAGEDTDEAAVAAVSEDDATEAAVELAPEGMDSGGDTIGGSVEGADAPETDEMDATEAGADASEPGEPEDLTAGEVRDDLEPLNLAEPLNLVDPIVTDAQAEAATPEWEPVAPPEQGDTPVAEPALGVDTVLAGPWSAAAAETGTADSGDADIGEEDLAAGAEAGAPADEPAAPEAEASEEAMGRMPEVPVGALEWEPVASPLESEAETDTAPETPDLGEPDLEMEASDGTESTAFDAGEGDGETVAFDAEAGSEDLDSQGEFEAELDEAGADLSTLEDASAAAPDGPEDLGDAEVGAEDVGHEDLGAEDLGAADVGGEDLDDAEVGAADLGAVLQDPSDAAIDADAAAVAAAAEAEVDWGDAGMAAAGVAAMTVALNDPQDQDLGQDQDRELGQDHDQVRDGDDESAARDSGGTVATPAEDETIIDEAMLRELVAQLVRDELQGTVGERITHNVRRLIRREIARALTLQDFEK